GQYAFDLSGQNLTTGAPLAIAGEFAANGSGGLTGGVMDIHGGGSSGPPSSAIPPATFTMNANVGASDGRGTVNINGQAVAFYVVDGTRFRFLEEDANAITVGDAFVQTGTIPTQAASLTGNFAFISAGGAVLGTFGSIARVGSAGFNAGAISSAFLDDNNAGKYTKLGPDSGSYTIDAAGSGRGTFTFTDSSGGIFSYIFYLYSPTQAVLLEASNGMIGSGSMS